VDIGQAVVGAITALAAAGIGAGTVVWATQRQIRSVALESKREQLAASDGRRLGLVRTALDEVRVNRRVLAEPSLPAGAWLSASTEAIDALRVELPPGAQELFERLLRTSRALLRYNTVVDYWTARLVHGLQKPSAEHVTQELQPAMNELGGLEPDLENLLAAHDTPQHSGALWPWPKLLA
jgi:hypothetical protein